MVFFVGYTKRKPISSRKISELFLIVVKTNQKYRKLYNLSPNHIVVFWHYIYLPLVIKFLH